MENNNGVKINAGLRVLAHSPTCLQIGTGAVSIIVDGLTAADHRFIGELRRGVARHAVAAAAAKCGLPDGRAEALLEALGPVLVETDAAAVPLGGLRGDRLEPDARLWSAGYQCDGHAVVARRARAVVQVVGLGRTGSAIAQALAAAGVGTLVLDDPATVSPSDVGAGSYRLADVGMPRVQATRRQIRQIDPTVQAHALRMRGGPLAPAPGTGPGPAPGAASGQAATVAPRTLDLAICVGGAAASRSVCGYLMQAEVPHLAVLLREQDCQVGPLVVPGAGACLDCLDRHRAGMDPAWQAGWEDQPAIDQDGRALPLGEVTQSIAIAGLAAMQALLFVDGVNQPSAWSAAWQLRSSDGLFTRRTYRPHPDCACRLQGAAKEDVA
jgi:hypothetical protein